MKKNTLYHKPHDRPLHSSGFCPPSGHHEEGERQLRHGHPRRLPRPPPPPETLHRGPHPEGPGKETRRVAGAKQVPRIPGRDDPGERPGPRDQRGQSRRDEAPRAAELTVSTR